MHESISQGCIYPFYIARLHSLVHDSSVTWKRTMAERHLTGSMGSDLPMFTFQNITMYIRRRQWALLCQFAPFPNLTMHIRRRQWALLCQFAPFHNLTMHIRPKHKVPDVCFYSLHPQSLFSSLSVLIYYSTSISRAM